MSHTTQSIAELVGGELAGPGGLAIDGVAEISRARPGTVTFIGSEKYAGKWPASHATAALVSRGVEVPPIDGRAVITVDNADLAMATLLALFAPPVPRPAAGVHPSATVDPSAELGPGVCIGANCVVEAGVKLGEGTILHAGVTLYNEVAVGAGCELWAGVVVRERCTIGDRCILHPNAVIGACGFGYRPDLSGPTPRLVKIPQIGTVEIGNDVEIGAGTTIDRAKFDATVVGDGCKLDNQVQIGHNVVIGRMVIIAGCTGIAGSSTIGDGTMIGGLTCVSDHIHVGRGVQLAGGSACINDIPDGETWGGVPARPLKEAFREQAALRKLPDLMREIKRTQRQADKKDKEATR